MTDDARTIGLRPEPDAGPRPIEKAIAMATAPPGWTIRTDCSAFTTGGQTRRICECYRPQSTAMARSG